MKKVLITLALVGAVAAVPLSHEAMAGPAPKVNVCHNVTTTTTTRDCPRGDGEVTIIVQEGQVINVSANAVPAHAAHGDFPAPPTLSAGDDCRRRQVIDRCRAPR